MINDLMKSAKPKTTIAPMLSVRNGEKAIEFYKAAFGAIELFRISNDTGEVAAHLSLAESKFWLADKSPEHSNSVQNLFVALLYIW